MGRYSADSTKALRLRGKEAAQQRKRITALRPLCSMCKAKGITTAGIELDHIKALVHGGDNADDNMQLLCAPCHREKTDVEMGWLPRGHDKDGWPISPRHPLGPRGDKDDPLSRRVIDRK